MALSRVHTWAAGEILLASDLNAEFNNILTNANSLISPLTANLNGGGFTINNLGNVGVGSSAIAGSGVYVTIGNTDSGSGAAFNASPTWASASLTTSGNAFVAAPQISGTATVPLMTGFLALGGTMQQGASTVTAWSAFDAFSLPTGGTLTSTYGFRGRYAAGSGRYNLYMDGTAQNYLGGILTIGSGATSVAGSGTDIVLGATTQTTIGANGAATAPTANPLGYLVFYKGSTKCVIPYYNG